ncbi:MAG TPA: 50S ribosomal protein L29 [Candidatus Limnocylindrales bacterium]|nr:50S ribosomal protein L29 [Candidatus Limnocylindrales bacterium]
MIEFAQIRKMSDRELEDALKQAKQDLWSARFALQTRQLASTSTIPQHRRTIARIMTVQRERQLGGPSSRSATSAPSPAAVTAEPAAAPATTKRTKR